jgi:biopolymer transport protein ExbB/TolQ
MSKLISGLLSHFYAVIFISTIVVCVCLLIIACLVANWAARRGVERALRDFLMDNDQYENVMHQLKEMDEKVTNVESHIEAIDRQSLYAAKYGKALYQNMKK